MRKKRLSRFAAAALSVLMGVSLLNPLQSGVAVVEAAGESVSINENTFPDRVFREYVSAEFDSDKNGVLSDSEIAAVEEIYIGNEGCSSLEGIGYFTQLRILDCRSNQLTSLDLGKNKLIEILDCSCNMLTSLDISQKTALWEVHCSDNQLTTLNVVGDIKLLSLNANNNKLEWIDISTNSQLLEFGCDDNKLSGLNVSRNVNLQELYCRNNQLSSLDLSKNGALVELSCSWNYLTALNLCSTNVWNEDYLNNLEIGNQIDGREMVVTVPEAYVSVIKNRLNASNNNSNVRVNGTALTRKVVIDYHPKAETCNAGEVAQFSVKATGDELTYQWYWRKDSQSSWAAVAFPGNKSSILNVEAIFARNGYEYRCQVKDKYGNTVTSSSAVLTVRNTAMITKQPASVSVEGGTVNFTVGASGEGLTYLWYWRKNSSEEWSSNGVTTATFSVEAISARSGFEYRCQVKDKYGNVVVSNPAVLTVRKKIAITKQPASVTSPGGTVSFSVAATGDGISYLWYWRKNSTLDWSSNGVTTPTLNIEATAARNGFEYRCRIKDKYGNIVYTNPATLTFKQTLAITKHPVSTTATGGMVNFSVSADGEGLSYQWYWRKTSSAEWSAYSATTASFNVEAIPARNGFEYRCRVKDKYGNIVYSNPATLTVKRDLIITKQPVNVTSSGGTVNFTVGATGDGVSYQWYWRKNSSSEWSKHAANTATCSVEAISARNGFEYRCQIKDKYGNTAISNTAILTYKSSLVITKQPVNASAASGMVTFSIGATGDGLSYQWYWRRNSTLEWSTYSATTASFNVEAISARNGFEYRCRVKDKYGNMVYSDPVTLTVTMKPLLIEKQPADAHASGQNVNFSVGASGDGLTYQWYWRRNENSDWGACSFTGSKTAVMTVEAIPARNGFQYRCLVRDKYGKTVYSEPGTLYVP